MKNTYISKLLPLFVFAVLMACRAEAYTLDVYPFNVQGGILESVPKSKLVIGPDGAFYGVGAQGGGGPAAGYGFIFRVEASGSGSVIHVFTNGNDGEAPLSSLIVGPDGQTMYGLDSSSGFNSAEFYAVTTDGTVTPKHIFAANDALEGSYSNGTADYSLVLVDGTFYGVTQYGGLNNTGIVFSVTPSGSFHKLHDFGALDANGFNSDGANPLGGLTLGADGNLWGEGYNGGQFGNGTIFKMPPGGTLVPVYSFSAVDGNGENMDGKNPRGQLSEAADGTLWGVAENGEVDGFGGIFEVTGTGNVTPYYYFEGGKLGDFPDSVDIGPDQSLCGVTSGGEFAGGSFFIIYPDHKTLDYSFTGDEDGEFPSPGLVLGPDGNLYGTTYASNAGADPGTFFEIKLSDKKIEPYSIPAGRYFGLLNDGDGDVTIKLAPDGEVTANLLENGKHTSYRHALDGSNDFDETVRGNELKMSLQDVGGAYAFTGTGAGMAFAAYRSAYDAGEPAVNTGNYTVILYGPSNLGTTPIPQGYGEELMTVTKKGVVSIGGSLPDGSALRTSGLLLQGTDGDDHYLFYNNADLQGSFTFLPAQPISKAIGTVTWTGKPNARNRYFPLGFSELLNVVAELYAPPARGGTVLPVDSAISVRINGGGLTSEIQATAALASDDKVTVASETDQLKITITPRTGKFTGSFVEPGATRRTEIHGEIFQPENAARGSFLGPVTSGADVCGTIVLQE